jgi:hypothetical protein
VKESVAEGRRSSTSDLDLVDLGVPVEEAVGCYVKHVYETTMEELRSLRVNAAWCLFVIRVRELFGASVKHSLIQA